MLYCTVLQEKEQRKEELKRLKNLKKKEILERLERLKSQPHPTLALVTYSL